jgi:hypothetical protein
MVYPSICESLFFRDFIESLRRLCPWPGYGFAKSLEVCGILSGARSFRAIRADHLGDLAKDRPQGDPLTTHCPAAQGAH